MPRSPQQLRDDALAIWRAGVDAVHPARLMPEFVHVDRDVLYFGDEEIPLSSVRRLFVVGGGKASGAMAAALETELGIDLLVAKRVSSCVNVPAGGSTETAILEIDEVRPGGTNEPTEEAAAGAEDMLRLVGSMGPDDLCFCLISGGGSALMPLPIEGISLADKVALIRELSARGAAIHELNAVRRALSRIKGGGLARACGGGRLISLILSDVPGDDLATIASGPTALAPVDVHEAAGVLRRFRLDGLEAGQRALARLAAAPLIERPPLCQVTNLVIGNNATAVDGAGIDAERLGYSYAMLAADDQEGRVQDVARWLVDMAVQMRDNDGPDCLISGGEPTVTLAPVDRRGLGGRNQQLCLAALAELADWRGLALVSGGTDGEDGPTDAAGAWVDENSAMAAAASGLDAADYLTRNDAYRFFEHAGGLLKTGPTHTNVADLRVVTVSR
jgi:glycerate 2-kinase